MTTLFKLKQDILTKDNPVDDGFVDDVQSALTEDYAITYRQAKLLCELTLSSMKDAEPHQFIDEVRNKTEEFCLIRDLDSDFYNVGRGYTGGALTRKVVIADEHHAIIITFQLQDPDTDIKKALQYSIIDYMKTHHGQARSIAIGLPGWEDIAYLIPNEILKEHDLCRISVSSWSDDNTSAFATVGDQPNVVLFDWNESLLPPAAVHPTTNAN